METLLILAGVLIAIFVAGQLGITHILTMNWTRSGEQIAKNVTLTGDNEINNDFELGDQEANLAVNTDIDASELVGLYISSDADITLKANSSSEPDFTLTVTADKPLVWYSGCGLPNPLLDAEAALTDVATWYASTTDEDGATVKIRALYNNA